MAKVSFKAGSRGARKRKEIAEAIAREHPGMDMAKKFRIATAATKRTRRGAHGRSL